MAAEARGPFWWVPRGQGIWPRGPTPFFLLVSVSSIPLRLRFVPSKKQIPVKFQVIWTSFGRLKRKNIEKGVF